MLEGLAAWVLNTYVGEYLENLNTAQLSIGLLQGEVELENLPLKKDALRCLGLPVEIKSGFVGKIKLQIPVYRLRSEPWVISIEKLYLVAGPLIKEQYDGERDEQVAQDFKHRQLDALESKWKAENKDQKESSYYAYSYSSWLSYGSSLVSNIADNIQLKIKDVHIRYEDSSSIPNSSFACGILLKNISAQSTDETWEAKYVVRDETDLMRKLLELENLAVYWDTSSIMLGHLENQEFVIAMERQAESCITSQGWVKGHEFLLSHVCAKAHLQRNCSVQPLRSRLTPRLHCDLHLEKIPLTLTEVQYKQMVDWLREFKKLETLLKYRKWHPTEPVRSNVKAWWKFAILTHLEKIQKSNMRNTWDFANQRAKYIVSYVDLYHCHLTTPEGLTPSMKAEKDDIEFELSFDELCILRQLVTNQIQKQTKSSTDNSPSEEKSKGLLQSLFPGWSGWYSSTSETEPTAQSDENQPGFEDFRNKIEGEILDVLDSVENDSVLKRDTVFARLNFSLDQGSFTLVGNLLKDPVNTSSDTSKEDSTIRMKPLIELEFSDVKTVLETRPRNGSYLFEIKLGALYLHDKVIPQPVFPHIIFPQSKEISVSYSKNISYGISFGNKPSILRPSYLPLITQINQTDTGIDPLFDLLYEFKPFGSKCDHRLIIATKPLDMIYNPLALRALVDFFSLSNYRDQEKDVMHLSAAARSRYEIIKNQTKRDLKLKLEQILEGEEKYPEAVHWEIALDISAPQIIIPDNLQDKHATVVVFDLGRFRFSNYSQTVKKPEKEEIDDSDDDEFKTPCSTPVEMDDDVSETNSSWFTQETINSAESCQSFDNSEIPIRERLYEKYTMELCDMQVLVGRAKDNWKFAQIRGTSTMHILDRFSISIHLERRLLHSTDPLWPAITIAGNLPKIVLHVNEQKVQALHTCIEIVNTPVGRVRKRSRISPSDEKTDSFSEPNTPERQIEMENERKHHEEKREISAESVLLLMQFSVDQLSLEVQSRGRSVAELQVTGVKASFNKRPFDLSVTLGVHSLLLVDAMQTYGPDFELLIASHKRVSMDSMSGSLKDSEPNSPTSPASPNFGHSPPPSTLGPGSSVALTQALSSLQSTERKGDGGSQLGATSSTEIQDSDALISVEFKQITSGEDDTLKLISVQFNNLDVIANQETIVELVGFVRRVANLKGHQTIFTPITPDEIQHSSDITEDEKTVDVINNKIELTFDFHHLNVLLLRATTKKRNTKGLKIATATLSGAKIRASIGKDIEISGALGGLQVLDLITEGTKHQRILSVGHDPLANRTVDLESRLHSEIYKPSLNLNNERDQEKALSFTVKHSRVETNSIESIFVTIRMASVCYCHSPKPLSELASCAVEVQDYISSLASSIKSAATEVAKGIVGRWPDFGGGVLSDSIVCDLNEFAQSTEINSSTYNGKVSSIDVRLDVLLQTPVVVLPTSPCSPDVLVAHLGCITVQNINSAMLQSPEFSLYSCDPFRGDTLFLEIRDMNLHSLNIEENVLKTKDSNSSFLPIHELYCCTNHGIPILHDTLIECTIDKSILYRESSTEPDQTNVFGFEDENDGLLEQHIVQVRGEVVTPLKVVLTKQQYEEVFKILDNLTYSENETQTSENLPRSDSTLDPSEDDLFFGGGGSFVKLPKFTNLREKSIDSGPLSILARFSVPEFTLQLSSDRGEREQGLVKLSFQNFILHYEKKEEFETNFQVTLHGLIMEDLLEPLQSKHRLLMASVSRQTRSKSNGLTSLRSEYLSNSCPDMVYHEPFTVMSHLSLPDHLNTQNLFQLQQSRQKRFSSHGTIKTNKRSMKPNGTSSYPSTPPPSPSNERSNQSTSSSGNALVHINVLLVDPNSPNFEKKHKKIHRFIDIDFNCLETTINLHTWVMVLDFFGIGSDPTLTSNASPMTEESPGITNDSTTTLEDEPRQCINSEIDVNVSSLTLILNKTEYELAKANVSKLSAHLSLSENNLAIQGSLGSMSLLDLTHPNGLYKERFITTGKEALHFDVFKYGAPDPELKREYDIRVKCRMSSVQYLHTHLFQAETLAFFQYFSQLQDFMARIRAAAAGTMLTTLASRGSRILLDISAGSPIIVIPHSYASSNVLVAILGKLTVRNKFLLAGSPGTISKVSRVISPDFSICESDNGKTDLMSQSLYGSFDCDGRSQEMERTGAEFMIEKYFEKRIVLPDHVCLMDVMNVELSNMDLYSAVRVSKYDSKLFDDVTPNLSKDSIEFPSFYIQREGGQLLKENFMLRVQVERNLDSEISHAVPDMTMQGIFSSVHFLIDQSQYKLIQGILNYNLGESTDQFIGNVGKIEEPNFQTMMSGRSWTCIAINLDLVNVTLELVSSHSRTDCANSGSPLAKFDFIKSRLSYESFSDQSKDIDLVSHEIRVLDTRYQNEPVNTRPNVFTNILQPSKCESNASLLQAEVHYRNTRDMTRFTVLLNNMRVMGVFDWLKTVGDFIRVSPDAPPGFHQNTTIPASKSYYGSFQSNQMENAKQPYPIFELKLNVTDTELVIVEDTALWDTNAVILKATAVLSYRSGVLEKPLSCSLQSLEVFSAILGIEDETALSIIDPVTVNVEITGKSSSLSRSTLTPDNTVHTLEISMMNINLRLSYHDITMFLQIIESFKRQTGIDLKKTDKSRISEEKMEFSSSLLDQLQSLGFAESDCLKALENCNGKLDEAALWLTKNAIHTNELSRNNNSPSNLDERTINLQCIDVRLDSGCLCIIDDCDADVPLLDFTLSDFVIQQKLVNCEEGSSIFTLSGDYFNRSLSGWEPVIEPWRCSMKWKKMNQNSSQFNIRLEAEEVLNLNVSSTLLELYSTVKTNWMEDYFKTGSKKSNEETTSTSLHRNRQPFVPFALKNDTGCKLWYATLTTLSDSPESTSMPTSRSHSNTDLNALTWEEVNPNQIVPFSFEGRGKIRHRKSHELKIHQLLVRVDGWQQVTPVSLDRIGVYFRQAKPQVCRSASIYVEVPPARVVFDVTLEGSAKKLVTVRSALLIKNTLRDTMELQLKHSTVCSGASSQTLFLVPDSVTPVPLNFVYAQIYARPCDRLVSLINNPIAWQHLTKINDTSGNIVMCRPVSSSATCYSFCAYVKRLSFPPNAPPSQSSHFQSNPGHKIVLLPALEIVNLLPYELHFYLRYPEMKNYIKPGKSIHLHQVDVCEQLVFRFSLENFCKSTDIIINRSNHDFVLRLELYDNDDRLLTLAARVVVLPGGAMKVYVSAPYWMVNRTGLPLVFKQEGTQVEGAGQFKEHEMARSVTPLLFSLSDNEASVMCSMRVGKSLHLDGAPQWCSRFHLEQGISVRRLRVNSLDSRPDWVYIIGIDVQRGRGKYQDTYIITLSPRFHLNNKSMHKLEFAQKFATKQNPTGFLKPQSYIMSAMPKCSLPFHWPRVDLDNLLCVRRVDFSDCNWSGGFQIEKINSFHVNMRDGQGQSHFLRVEILLQRSTFFIMFTDADKMPPPFRIDNRSEVFVNYYQTNVKEERLESLVKAHTSVPYAFDEPSLPSLITCCAPGGSNDTYNMDVFGEGKPLFYENFIYIVFTGTFQKQFGDSTKREDITVQELVLDVPQGTRVVLSGKEPGKRSQLWRMTTTGMLQHEGSSPPRDHRRASAPPPDNSRTLFLDIGGLGPRPGQYAPLMLRKQDERRGFTQTWNFTEDGRLTCRHPNMYVQAKDGFMGLKPGNDAVLGPSQSICYSTLENGIPIEQGVSNHKLRKGCGVLSVKVVPDGPTRVLQITDLMQKQVVGRTAATSEWVVVEERDRLLEVKDAKNDSDSTKGNVTDEDTSKTKLLITVHLSGGLGISTINHLGEELVYGLLQNIMVEYSRSLSGASFDGSIQNIKIDNQLRDAERSAVLYVTPLNRNDQQRHLPALHITAHRSTTPRSNTEIFKHLIVTVKSVSLLMEEKLMLKLVQFIGLHENGEELVNFDEQDRHVSKTLAITCPQGRRYYFSMLKLSLPQVRLSCVTSSNLPQDLLKIKKKTGWTLIRFEDAIVKLDPFLSVHPFETIQFLTESVVDHYQGELRSQAAKILGAVNFLGNPLGLVNDVSDGLSGLLYDGNVGGLFKNVAHGLSNSAAKMTGTLSDSLGMVTMDDKHQTIRNRIRQETTSSGGDQLMAGLRGLSFGLLGGVTSIFTQTYEGATNEGVQGFLTGLGKGLVGTVTKPTVGFLDFASGAAGAVRDTSKRSTHTAPIRIRSPRLCVGRGGLIQRFSWPQAIGQELLYSLNGRNYEELCIAYEQLRSSSEDLRVLVTSHQVHILSQNPPSVNVVTTAPLSDLISCQCVTSEAGVVGEIRYYLQLIMKTDSGSGSRQSPSSVEQLCKRPKVRCDTEQIGERVAQLINYARNLYEEKKYTVAVGDDIHDKDE